MKLLIQIPKEFEEHFNMDKFKDSFERVSADIKYGLKSSEFRMAGLYELELIEILKNAFIKAEVKE